MAFQFNFSVGGQFKDTQKDTNTYDFEDINCCISHHTRKGERFFWSQTTNRDIFDFKCVVIEPMDGRQLYSQGLKFSIVNTADPSFIEQTGEISSILNTSDLRSGVYEGGFKLWECSLDLIKYLDFIIHSSQEKYEIPSKVMELGCGHGLPGIFVMKQGALHVNFMDYNKEVLELTTCPNVLKNVGSELYQRASFYAGAWESVSTYMGTIECLSNEEMQYDLILSAETIYTECITVELYEMIKRHLHKSATSVALVAAKKYYFGTGGSVQHFMELVQSEGKLNAQIVWEEADSRSNIRSIVRLIWVM